MNRPDLTDCRSLRVAAASLLVLTAFAASPVLAQTPPAAEAAAESMPASAPESAEDARARRQAAAEARRQEAEARRREREASCVIRPVMTDAEIAHCKAVWR